MAERVLKAELRLVGRPGTQLLGLGLEHERGCRPGRHSDLDPFHVSQRLLDLWKKRGCRPQRPVHVVAGGKGLERDPACLPPLAEIIQLLSESLAALTDEGAVEAEAGFEDPGRPLGTFGCELGCEDAALRREPGVQWLRRCSVIEVGEQAGCHASRKSERADGPFPVEAEQAGRGRRGSEDAADRGGVEAAVVEGAGRGQPDPGDRLVSRNDRGECACTGRVRPLACREGRWADDGARVGNGARVCVVEVECMAKRSVCERSIRGGVSTLEPEDGGLLVTAAERVE
jgi:hypothetical protein